VIRARRGVFPLPDEVALYGAGRDAILYCVEFNSSDLWGPNEEKHLVYVDLFADYLTESDAP
jgi:hypothetical protein